MPEGIRFDRATLSPSWEKTPEGFLRVKAHFARTGLQRYRNPDGSIRVELRPEEEVARKDAILSLGGLPVTLEHPPELLTPDTAAQYQKGATGSRIEYDDGFVTGTITLTDREAIEAVERKDAREISVGYRVEYDPTPGVFEGQRFDGVQRKISGNHVAVVRRARGGPELRIHMDAADVDCAFSVDRIDGQSPQLEDDMATAAALGTAVIEHLTDSLNTHRTDAGKGKKPMAPAPDEEWTDPEAAESSADEPEEEEMDMAEEMDGAPMRGKKAACDSADELVPANLYREAIQARNDAITELETEKGRNIALSQRLNAIEALVDERLDSEPDISALVRERLALERKAEQLTGNRLDGQEDLSSRELMLSAMEAVGADLDRFDGRSDEAVEAAFETYLEAPGLQHGSREDAATTLALALGSLSLRTDADDDPIEAARQRSIEAAQKAYLGSS